MDTNPAPLTDRHSGGVPVAQLAKATLRRLVLEKLEPTPDNYARAYAQEAGGAKPPALPEAALSIVRKLADRAFNGDTQARASNVCLALAEGQWERAQALLGGRDDCAQQLAALIERLVRGVERGGRSWTPARKKDSLQRVLQGSHSDLQRLKQRLQQLVTSWESDAPGAAVEAGEAEDPAAAAVVPPAAKGTAHPAACGTAVAEPTAAVGEAADRQAWMRVVDSLSASLSCALPDADVDSRGVQLAIADSARKLGVQGPTSAVVTELAQVCKSAQRALQHRHHLIEQLGRLCREMPASMADLAESDSWAKGQCEAMHNTLKDGITARGVKAVNELLQSTRRRQGELRAEREQARGALKSLISSMLIDLGELGSQTGRFYDNVGRYTDVIEKADTLDSLTLVVREMVEESGAVHKLVAQTQARLHEEHAKASGLSERVNQLESELRRLSDEVTTDQLTQVANRRGLLKVFEVERARMERCGSPLAIGLLDIDNFKRLNDELGHAAGDLALKSLAALVSKTLRASDLVARYGGEEFVVLLPETALPEAQATLTRLQRHLSSGLFLHEQKEVLVTFSAGVTACRSGERIEDVLERADQALYEAKRTGKNRTCIG